MFCVKGNQAFCYLILICSVIFVVGDDAEHTYIKTDYCDYKCNEAPYMTTICLRKRQCGPVNDTCEEVGGTVEFRKEALDAINKFRNDLASRREDFRYTYTPIPLRMNALSYDLELEYIAQCYINLCKDVIEKCVASKRFPYAKGILMAEKDSSISKICDRIYLLNAMNSVAWEMRKSFDSNISYTYHNCDLNKMILTILSFDYIKYVGCGASKYRGTTNHLYYCIFGLTENPDGKPVFESSFNLDDRASKCVTRNQKYNYLCGNIEPIPIEPSWTNRQEKGLTNVYLEFGINPASTASSIHFIYYTVRFLVICLGLLLHVIIIS